MTETISRQHDQRQSPTKHETHLSFYNSQNRELDKFVEVYFGHLKTK